MKMIAVGILFSALLVAMSSVVADAKPAAKLPPEELHRYYLNYPKYWAKEGVKVFRGGWFDIQYPAGFKARGGQRSNWPPYYDSAFFKSPDGRVEFAVFAPQFCGNKDSIDILPQSAVEKVVSRKTSVSRGKDYDTAQGSVTWVSTVAKDGSYSRYIIYYHGKGEDSVYVSRAISIKFKDLKSYRKYRKDYENFSNSLIRYGD